MNEHLKSPTGDNLLDSKSREKLPALYSGEELGLMAIALVKFFTPDSNWSWYASEFDQEDLFLDWFRGLKLNLVISHFQNFNLSKDHWACQLSEIFITNLKPSKN